jgi:hypothetical protein
MSQTDTGSVTTIDPDYLKSLINNQLQPLLDQVNTLLNPTGQYGMTDLGGSSILIPPVNGKLTVQAGGTPGQNGTTSFNVADTLNAALQSMGGSVEDELNWLQKVLSDMIEEINTTITSMQSTDSLNTMDAQTLAQDFQTTISDVTSPPVSGSSGGSSGSSSGGSNGLPVPRG